MTKSLQKGIKRKEKGKKIGGRKDMEKGQNKRLNKDVGKGGKGRRQKIRSEGKYREKETH
jgi:hypothetical protein